MRFARSNHQVLLPALASVSMIDGTSFEEFVLNDDDAAEI